MATQVWVATAAIYLNNVRAYNLNYIVPDSVVTLFGLEAEGLVERRDVDDSGTPTHGVNPVTQAELDAALADKIGQATGDARYARAIGERLRKADAAARGQNSVERGVMTTPPTITTGNATLDATLTETFYVDQGKAGAYAFRGGTPTVYSSAYYRFPVVTLPTGTGNADATHNAVGWAVDFWTDAPKLQLVMLNQTSGGVGIEIDGQKAAATPTPYPGTGGTGYFLLDFTSAGGRQARRIRIEGFAAGAWRGVAVNPNDTVWAPAADTIRFTTVGDSVSISTGATDPNGGWQHTAAKLLGWADVRQVGLGGSGFVTPGPNNSPFGHSQRVADAVATNPDILCFSTSTNDVPATAADVQAAALAAFRAYRTALPGVPIVVTGMFPGSVGPSAAQIAREASVKAAFDTWADPLSFFIPVSPSNVKVEAWVTGAGKVGAPSGNGNADIYSGDGTHPSPAGHVYFGRRFANAVRERVLPRL